MRAVTLLLVAAIIMAVTADHSIHANPHQLAGIQAHRGNHQHGHFLTHHNREYTPTQRLEGLGMPAHFNTDPAAIVPFLKVQFPQLMQPLPPKFESLNSTEQGVFLTQYIRLSMVLAALDERATPEDVKMAALIRSAFSVCSVCQWAISHIEGYIISGGCGYASKFVGQICDAIPWVGPIVMPLCVKLLDWGCEKLADDIKKHITSPKDLCHDVFHTC